MKFFSAHEHWKSSNKKQTKDSNFTLFQGFILAQPLIYSFIAWFFLSTVIITGEPVKTLGIIPPLIGFMVGLIGIIFYIITTSTLTHKPYYTITKLIFGGLLIFTSIILGIDYYFSSFWI
ncbi:MAG: hypothetical protein KAH22_05525 [Thiotrichaceae bacterium]|nr:hypothetical protein [Thiotrichaceae bacterium]